MDTQSTTSSPRRGTPGLDIFKIAGRSISGFLPSFKTGDPSYVRQPFTTQLEERLAPYLEYHPHVRMYQRGDVSLAFAQARHLHTPLGTPYRISYLYDGKPHDYRLPGTTKATPQDRGTYDSVQEAEKAGMTFDVLEKLFIQAIVDGYMQEWDKLRRQTHIALWEDSVREKGVPRWMGSPDDLKLLLMKAVNRKNAASGRYAITHGTLSFLGRRYVSPGLLDRLRGKEIDIYFDRRDISVIYLFLEGVLVGEAYCTEFLERRHTCASLRISSASRSSRRSTGHRNGPFTSAEIAEG